MIVISSTRFDVLNFAKPCGVNYWDMDGVSWKFLMAENQ
jgi:hypothetical protein